MTETRTTNGNGSRHGGLHGDDTRIALRNPPLSPVVDQQALLAPHDPVGMVAAQSIGDILASAQLDTESILRSANETLKGVDAEMELQEEVSVIFERDRTVVSSKRSIRTGHEQRR